MLTAEHLECTRDEDLKMFSKALNEFTVIKNLNVYSYTFLLQVN